MGYTHYWQFNSVHGKTREAEALYQKAIVDCNTFIKSYYVMYKGTNCSLSGYSAHSEDYGGINFNGKGKMAHEDFILREHLKENSGFNFCKTARKPYDVVAVACLAILKHHLGNIIEVSSDGSHHDFIEGTIYAQNVLKIDIANPLYEDLKSANS